MVQLHADKVNAVTNMDPVCALENNKLDENTGTSLNKDGEETKEMAKLSLSDTQDAAAEIASIDSSSTIDAETNASKKAKKSKTKKKKQHKPVSAIAKKKTTLGSFMPLLKE